MLLWFYGESVDFVSLKEKSIVMKAILFSGVHGVGKGFYLDRVKKYIKNYDVYSASSLIERYQSPTDAGYKKVRNVNQNQDVLIKAIREVKKNNKKDFILDGHLCIFNAKEEIVRIPEYFFTDAQISGIVILQDDPRKICDRIRQRDSYKVNINILEQMQEEERKYARDLQRKDKINYIIISHECTGEQFEENLRNIGGVYNE